MMKLDRRRMAPLASWGHAMAIAVLAAASFALPAQAQTNQAKPAAPVGPATPAAGDGKDAGPVPAAPPEGSVGGMGDINLYPKRVVIDDKQRVASVGLYNKAVATGDYDITISDMMMTPDGRLVELGTIKDDAERAKVKVASSYLRWSPHRVTLPGNEAQMVRIMAHVPPDLPPGEYRSHFSAIAVPPDEGGLSITDAAGQQKASGIGVKITPRFGISIPVILRVGETTLTVSMTGFAITALPSGAKALTFKIHREGTRSCFGDIEVTTPGAKKPLVLAKGVGAYTELTERSVTIPFDPATDAKLISPGAHLTITYTDDDYAPGKTLAQQEFVVP